MTQVNGDFKIHTFRVGKRKISVNGEYGNPDTHANGLLLSSSSLNEKVSATPWPAVKEESIIQARRSATGHGDSGVLEESSRDENEDPTVCAVVEIGRGEGHEPLPQEPPISYALSEDSSVMDNPISDEWVHIDQQKTPTTRVKFFVRDIDHDTSHIPQQEPTPASSEESDYIKVELSPKFEELAQDVPTFSGTRQIRHRSRTSTTTARARSSIPSGIWPSEYARQSILAAYSSRLDPFGLHPAESQLLRSHINHSQVTIYLQIRNGILRLWTRNPLVSVTLDEAFGCAKEERYFNLARVAYEWLLRNGYINFGCVEVPHRDTHMPRSERKAASQKVIAIIGAGMSGLGCARQLENLLLQFGHRFAAQGEKSPKVIVLEGRKRVGGRIYSHPLRNQKAGIIPDGCRNTVETGAHIVTGYEHGNPLNAIVRGQLALPYHSLRDNTILYDSNGQPVNRKRDVQVEKLYNDVLERASAFRVKLGIPARTFGDSALIRAGKDPVIHDGPTIAQMEDSGDWSHTIFVDATPKVGRQTLSKSEKLTGKAYQISTNTSSVPSQKAAKDMGWKLRKGLSEEANVDLETFQNASKTRTLGDVMDEGLRQYQGLLDDMTPLDLRLFNWHNANLEYANAAMVHQLSLAGWDQDIGNEFEGEHSQIIGGYIQVPKGVWQSPTPLDIRFEKAVERINYRKKSDTRTTQEQPGSEFDSVQLHCYDGTVVDVDRVVVTTPLGVLKKSLSFEPALPDWKTDVIQRMGFGLLNKVILVYEEAFWETERDIFGLLNDGTVPDSLNPADYEDRGRFYLFWNCYKTSGQPVLIALMAGKAAHDVEDSANETLIADVTQRLSKMFPSKTVPRPSEAIITRWAKDPFACGTYSYVSPSTRPGDYELMARAVGNIHFAGEATCGTHPATVHGAYLSGLRAASEVLDSLIGPMIVPVPLIEPTEGLEHGDHSGRNGKFGNDYSPLTTPSKSREDGSDIRLREHITSVLGDRPPRPGKHGVNPFLLYQKDHWYICKNQTDAAKQESTGKADARASKIEIRQALGKMWREAPESEKKPYLEMCETNRSNADRGIEEWKTKAEKWDRDAQKVREAWKLEKLRT